jgi:hypothetical protein
MESKENERMPLAIAIDQTRNSKLGPMATTYAAKSSCPDACPLKAKGACYGHMGPPASVWKRLQNGDPVAVAKAEAAVVDRLSGYLPLRLHTLGDCSTTEAAQILAAAAERYIAKHGQGVYTFTHAWRTIPRSAWGRINVLASCETLDECRQALALDYAASIVVNQHSSPKLHVEDDLRMLPCLKQTERSETCLACGLCLHADKLRKSRTVIEIAAHGPTKRVRMTLSEVNRDECKH